MRLSNNFFFKITLFVCFVFALILLLYKMDILSFEFIKAFILAGFITYLNFTLGFLSITLTFRKSSNIFLIAVFGGMVLRLFMMLIMIFISLKFLDIRVGVFIFVILFFYIVYLIIEIFYLLKKGSI
jgi:hypothetical protein